MDPRNWKTKLDGTYTRMLRVALYVEWMDRQTNEQF